MTDEQTMKEAYDDILAKYKVNWTKRRALKKIITDMQEDLNDMETEYNMCWNKARATGKITIPYLHGDQITQTRMRDLKTEILYAQRRYDELK